MAPYMNGNSIGAELNHDVHAHETKPIRVVGDFLSNVSNFSIIESTLREGEQFANAFFDTETKVKIARALDEFGCEYIELTSPASSEQSRRDCETIAKLGLKAKILTHVRCNLEDARLAVETGVDGVDVVGTSFERSAVLRRGHIPVNHANNEVLTPEFPQDLLRIYSAVDKVGVTRVGIADTVGVATPREVYELV
ncbi:MAG: hypothetical protein L6R39_001778 [Caloplaca ligustica]|nr:MAG: hypothetical protein L6R39_001778 [Caloplaca ligustica]